MILWVLLLAIIIFILGGRCAFKLHHKAPAFLKTLVLAPSFSMLFATGYIWVNELFHCPAFPVVLMMEVGFIALYLMIDNALGDNDNRWFKLFHVEPQNA
jgi:hypothetical protein